MELALCAATGLASGLAGGVVAAIIQLTAKRVRDRVRSRRGEPLTRDLTLVAWWWPTTAAGGLAGLGVGLAGYAWPIAALAGAALPALLVLLFVIIAIAQAFAR
jgi:hypothetical protein